MGDKPLTINWLKDKMTFNPKDDPRYELIEVSSDEGLLTMIQSIAQANESFSSVFKPFQVLLPR